MLVSILRRIWRFLISLKLAVILIFSLSLSLATATILESLYDIPTGRFWVYGALWFHILLLLLGVLIFCVALSRWPWKKKHIPFLLAHLGILLLLIGSWVSKIYGLDAHLVVTEGELGSKLEMDDLVFTIQGQDALVRKKISWLPPMATFTPIEIPEYGLTIDRFITHAEMKIDFASASPQSQEVQAPAVQFKFEVPALRFKKQFWLWTGDRSWSFTEVGPAQFVFYPPQKPGQGAFLFDHGLSWEQIFGQTASKTRLELQMTPQGDLHYRSVSMKGEVKERLLSKNNVEGQSLQTNWKGPMGSPVLVIQKWIPKAVNRTQYVVSRSQFGDESPGSAIHIRSGKGGEGAELWLGEGERAEWGFAGQKRTLSYGKRMLALPFGIQLERFKIEHYEGTLNPASFSSTVRVVDSGQSSDPLEISMNEPLKWRGYTFYQASYIPSEPRPTTSIFSVNKDPGRELKYIGSILIVLGSILLFAVKSLSKKRMKKTLPALFLFLSFGLASQSYAETSPVSTHSSWNFRKAAQIPIQSGGRVKPLDSFARETILLLTGSLTYKGWNSIDLLLSWISNPSVWSKEPIIKVSNLEVRRQLLLEESRIFFSPAELRSNPALIQYSEEFGEDLSGKQSSQEDNKLRMSRKKELRQVVQRLQAFYQLVAGQSLSVIPKEGSQPWGNLEELMSSNVSDSYKEFAEWIRAFYENDQKSFESISEKLSSTGTSKLSAEYFYNFLRPFFWSAILYFIAALLWTLILLSKNQKAPLLLGAAWVSSVLGVVIHVLGFSLRIFVTGRAPVSNMYESVIWVSFGILLFAFIIYFFQRQKILLAVATALGGFCLMAGDAAPAILDPSMDPLVPVLRSNYWLIIHVLTITLGYAAFALSLGIANVSLYQYLQIGLRRAKAGSLSRIEQLNLLTYRAVQFGVVLIAAGTILGGVWADYSWGRFWGWDPKEVWALIALLVYLAILHGRYSGWVGAFGFPVTTVLAFLSVLMSWYGVNFVLGVGLHTYGISNGGGFWVGSFVLAQLAYVAGVALCYKKTGHATIS